MEGDRIHVLVAYWRPDANAGGMETMEIEDLLRGYPNQIKPTYASSFSEALEHLSRDRTIDMLVTRAVAYDQNYDLPDWGRSYNGYDFSRKARCFFPTVPIALLESYHHDRQRDYDTDGIMCFSYLSREHSSLIGWMLSKPVVPKR